MDTLMLPVTSAAAVINGALLLYLTAAAIIRRRTEHIVLGDEGDREMLKRMRGHANAAEQIPIALILLALCELRGAPAIVLAAIMAVFTMGRIMHGYYFTHPGSTWRLRVYGMWMTAAGQGALLLVLLWTLAT